MVSSTWCQGWCWLAGWWLHGCVSDHRVGGCGAWRWYYTVTTTLRLLIKRLTSRTSHLVSKIKLGLVCEPAFIVSVVSFSAVFMKISNGEWWWVWNINIHIAEPYIVSIIGTSQCKFSSNLMKTKLDSNGVVCLERHKCFCGNNMNVNDLEDISRSFCGLSFKCNFISIHIINMLWI